MSPFMILALLVVIAIAFVVITYNKMIKMRNHADEAWSDIDVQLKRRYNLIPNLVEAVKGYATHEEGVFTKVTEARNMAINAGSMKEQAQAENMLSGALKSLFAVSENYPDLKANENFMQLQNELVDTEDKIQAARRFYNSTVRDFNTKLQQFPNSMIAKMFKFEDKEFFEVEDEEQKKNVEVSFAKSDEAESEGQNEDKKTEAVAPAETAAAPAVAETAAVETPAEPTPEAATPETPAEPAPEAPVETPAEPVVAEGEDQAKCEKCGGEMTEGHTCPMPEKTEEPAPAEPAVEEKPAEEPAVPAEPAKCEKCGGEMTEGHTCPMPEKTEEPAPAEPAEAESEGQEAPATPESAPEEKPAEETPVAEATEAPAAMEEDKPAEATPEAPAADEAAAKEENKDEEKPA